MTTVPALGLMPAFVSNAAPAAGGYVVYVANDDTDVTIDAEETHTGASVEITTDANASLILVKLSLWPLALTLRRRSMSR